MKRLAYAFAVLSLPWSASQALAADCNRPEYGSKELSASYDAFVPPCTALGIPIMQSIEQVCTDDRLAAAKADVDWVLSGNAAALEAYRASVREQVACGYPPLPLTFYRAVLVAVRPHDPLAQCMILACDFRIVRYLSDMDDQGKLPKY
jgi:hypothetical protein